MGNVESAPSLSIDFSALIADDGASDKESETPRRLPPKPPTLSPKGSSFLEEPVTKKITERGEADVSVSSAEIYSVGREGLADGSGRMYYAVSEMQGWRSHMEDRHCLNPTLSSNPQQKELLKDHHLFAVFDGHGGDFASYFCGEHFASTLVRQREWRSYLKLKGHSTASEMDSVKGVSLLKSALVATFLKLDARLMDAQRDRRLCQLSQLEELVHSLGGVTSQHNIFKEGTDDRHRVMNFDRTLPPSTMPANVPLERSGSTGVVVLITPTHIICANAGDSRAILSKRTNNRIVLSEDGVLPLSFDHKPEKDVEEARVRKDGGFVRAGRVDGDLAVSRSFGDFGFKNRRPEAREDEASTWNGMGSERTVSSVSTCSTATSATNDGRVTVRPDILVHKREPSRDEFVVLACDGIWDRLSNRACADIVRSLVHDEGETDAGLICEEIVDTALELDSRDNMTCCVALFPGAGAGGPEARLLRSIGGAGGVMERRRRRERTWGDGSTPAERARARLEERMRKSREATAHRNVQAMMRQARRKHQTLQLSASQEGGSPRGGGRSSRKNGAASSRSPRATTRKQGSAREGVKFASRFDDLESEGSRSGAAIVQ